PERMIAAEEETIAGATPDRLHPAPVRFNARGPWIMKAAAMNCAPEICVKLEIGAAPFLAHRGKNCFQMTLGCRMRTVERIPWSVTPTAEGYAIGTKRLSGGVFYEPIGMLREYT